MGFKKQNLKIKCDDNNYKHNLQHYYSKIYDEQVQKYYALQEDTVAILSSIFSRTKLPTNTHQNRQLALLDIDKIISFSNKSLLDNGDQVKMMRMVVGLKQQSSHSRQDNTNLRQIQNLVRMARLHFMSVRRQRIDQSQSENQPQNLQRLQQDLNRN